MRAAPARAGPTWPWSTAAEFNSICPQRPSAERPDEWIWSYAGLSAPHEGTREALCRLATDTLPPAEPRRNPDKMMSTTPARMWLVDTTGSSLR